MLPVPFFVDIGVDHYSWPSNNHRQLFPCGAHHISVSFPTNGHPMLTGPFDQLVTHIGTTRMEQGFESQSMQHLRTSAGG